MNLLEDCVTVVVDSTIDVRAGRPELHVCKVRVFVFDKSKVESSQVEEVSTGKLCAPLEILNLDEFEGGKVLVCLRKLRGVEEGRLDGDTGCRGPGVDAFLGRGICKTQNDSAFLVVRKCMGTVGLD